MGLTIYSKNLSNDLGAGGFLRLRRIVAFLCPFEIFEHYTYLLKHYSYIVSSDEEADTYDAGTEALYRQFGKTHGKVMDFLYASDVEAKFNYGVAKQLLTVIGDYDDQAVYGYAGWGDRAMKFKDFKAILQDAAETKTKWGWR
jgi:hypothetical protein